jgi:hypothetical protein
MVSSIQYSDAKLDEGRRSSDAAKQAGANAISPAAATSNTAKKQAIDIVAILLLIALASYGSAIRPATKPAY